MADTDFLPSAPPATPDAGGSQGDAVSEAKRVVLDQLAKSEDIASYAAEREDLENEEQTGEVETGAARAQRIREALEEARKDTAEAKQTNGLDDQLQDAQAQWEQQQQQEQWQLQQAERLLDATRNEAKFQAHAELLKQNNPQVWQTITDTLGTFDTLAQSDEQIDALKAGLTRDPREGMAIAYRLSQTSYNPDGSVLMTPAQKMEHLAGLSPQELSATLEQARIWTQVEGQVSRQYAQRYANQPRRQTAAPPPFRTPSGSAAAPRDMRSLAEKSDASDYIKARMAQERKVQER
jgi:hypothetical protein